MRQGVVLPETPRDRRNLQGLEEDMRDSPLAGQALPLRLRNFRPDATSYLASLGGPRPYMQRLREIDSLTAAHEEALAEAYAECRRRPGLWEAVAERWDFSEVNDLIDRHNRWYPAERGCRWIPGRATTRSSTASATRRRRSTPAGSSQRFPVAASVSAQSAPPSR